MMAESPALLSAPPILGMFPAGRRCEMGLCKVEALGSLIEGKCDTNGRRGFRMVSGSGQKVMRRARRMSPESRK